jgi:parallel beta-helix repeat protein
MSTRDVTLRNNTIARVNFGIGSRLAAIDIFAEVGKAPADPPVHQAIVIEHNTISESTGSAIHVGSAREVTIRNNTLVNSATPAIVADHSQGVVMSENTGFDR